MFYLIGIGLFDEKDITVKGLEIVKRANRVYLEHYTSILWKSKEDLEKFYGKELILADREMVEMQSDDILANADVEDVALLVAGDPFAATTHMDLILRARKKNIKTRIVHNASIFNAVACCGLQLYNFGETVSIPYWTDNWKPNSFLKRIESNLNSHLHTLCLLDIQVKEPTPESLMKKVKSYLPPRFMSVKEAATQLMDLVHSDASNKVLKEDTLCIGLSRVGADDQKIVACTLAEMTATDLGPPLQSLVIAAETLHPLEEEYITHSITMSSWKKASKVNQKTHQERQQLRSRGHLGFLEKKKDYKTRANHEHQRTLLIKSLKKRALNKNPDEFYFNMVNSKVVDDVHHVKRKEVKHTPEQLKLMQTRDLKYINSRRTMEVKKIDKLKSQLHFIDKADKTPNTHIFYVGDEEAKDFDLCRHLNTHPSLVNRRSNRPRLEDLEKYSFPDLDDASAKRANSKKTKMYRELEQRMEREKTLSVVQRKLEVKRELTRNSRGVKKVKPATPSSAPVYKWKQERKK